MYIWTVYDHPRDYPDAFVARRWEIGPGRFTATGEIFIAGSIDNVRAMLPPGLVCIKRLPGDDDVIAEVWL